MAAGLLLAAAALVAAVRPAAAEPTALLRFFLPPTSLAPHGIAAGPDGALWFTEFASDRIGRITTGGVQTFFPLPVGSAPLGITTGPDGALWFTEGGTSRIGRITTDGTLSEFALSTPGSQPTGIAAGPDGALWFTEAGGDRIGRITTGGVLIEFPLPMGTRPAGITAGPDGALWFTEFGRNRIGRITTGGVLTEFILGNGAQPTGITVGPDGALWFTEFGRGQIGRITTGGTMSEFPATDGTGQPFAITSHPDGALRFTDATGDVRQITTAGIVTTEAVDRAPTGIVTDASGNIWFASAGVGSNPTEVSASAIVAIAFNLPPTAIPLQVTTGEDTPVDVILIGANPEGAPLQFTIVTPPASGSLGPVTPLTATTARVTYTPDPDFFGSDSFAFSVSDGVFLSPPATIGLTITAVDDPVPPPTDRPVITAPASPAILTLPGSITFVWTALPGAAQYGFEFTGPNLTFANPNGTGPDPFNGFGGLGGGLLVATTTLSATFNAGDVPPGAYQVRVVGLSATFQFVGVFSDAITVIVQ
jgi:virginiamycin B lyase